VTISRFPKDLTTFRKLSNLKPHLTHHPLPLLGKEGSIPGGTGGMYSPPYQGGAGGGWVNCA